jgi:hypothetical protein
MGRTLRLTLAALLALAGLTIVGPATAAPAQTSGPEQSSGFLVSTGLSGERVVLASSIRMTGVFNGVGRIVEVPNQPTDPDNVSRDDLVFAQGVLHLISATQDFQISLDPRSCRFSATVEQVATFDGGTGVFSGASGGGTGRVDGSGILQRHLDGSCATDLGPAQELDRVSGSGTLSF